MQFIFKLKLEVFLLLYYKEEIKKYVNLLTPERAKKMKNSCIKKAKEFDASIFIKKLKNEIKLMKVDE